MEAASYSGVCGALSGITREMVASALTRVGLTFPSEEAIGKLAEYGNLIIRWNSVTNLTSIRDPEQIVERHLVESVAAAAVVPIGSTTLLDYGSGAGLPGIPISLILPELQVTLAESQSKKVAFLREAIRSLSLNTLVHPGRVDDLPSRAWFDVITLRAVDQMTEAVREARGRLTAAGSLIIYATTGTQQEMLVAADPSRWVKHLLPGGTLLLVCEA